MALLAASLLRDIREPFIGLHDFNTADHAQFARVMLRQPASVHHFLATYALGFERPEHPHHYAHHPPMITWLTALSFLLFGDSEWSARLAPIVCSLAGLWILMRLARELCDERTALLTALIYAVMPVGAYFGRMANHEAPTLCFSLLAVWGWTGLRNHAPHAARRHAAYLLGIACAIYSGWPGTIIAAAIALDALRLAVFSPPYKGGAGGGSSTARHATPLLLETALWPAVILVILLCHLVYAGLDGHWDVWWDLLTTRTAGALPLKQGDDPMRTFLGYSVQNFTWPALILAAIFLVAWLASIARGRTAKNARPIGTMWILAAAGLAHLCFYRQALIHHYWWFYCWPAVSYFAARGVLIVHSALRPMNVPLAHTTAIVGLSATAVCGLLNTNLYFSYVTYSPDKLAFWTDPALSRLIPRNAPILLVEPMAAREQHGAYTHWWWGEPATAYYMDRPFRLVTSPTDLQRQSKFSRYLVASEVWLARRSELKRSLAAVRPVYERWGYRVYDLASVQ